MKEMFLKILQNSLERICARVSFLIKTCASAYNFIKKETLAQVFSREFYNFLLLQNTSWWLLLSKKKQLLYKNKSITLLLKYDGIFQRRYLRSIKFTPEKYCITYNKEV